MKASSSAFSVLDLFTIGIGPSSSHTVGPIRAAATFASSLASVPVQVIRCDLFGSLADTGRGHGTDTAVILGFMGYDPSTVPIDEVATLLRAVEDRSELILPDGRRVGFTRKDHIIFHRGKNLGEHPNAMHFTAQAKDGSLLEEAVVYSIGRGFTLIEGENVVVELPSTKTKKVIVQVNHHLWIIREEGHPTVYLFIVTKCVWHIKGL